jgi:hypothetical protein
MKLVERSTLRTVLVRSDTEIVGSNHTQRGMDVYVRFFRVCVVLCVGSGLESGWSAVQVLPTVHWIKKLKKTAKDRQNIKRN